MPESDARVSQVYCANFLGRSEGNIAINGGLSSASSGGLRRVEAASQRVSEGVAQTLLPIFLQGGTPAVADEPGGLHESWSEGGVSLVRILYVPDVGWLVCCNWRFMESRACNHASTDMNSPLFIIFTRPSLQRLLQKAKQADCMLPRNLRVLF